MATAYASAQFPAAGGSFIGRAAERAQLTGLLTEAAGGAAATVFVAGEAGVGKSRLLQEFATEARSAGRTVLHGACINLGTGALPYAPLIDALRRIVRERGEQRVRELGGPSYAELSRLVSDFTGVAPLGESTAQLRVFGAVLRMLDHFGAHAPTVLIFEDLHWADPSTLDLISYLARAQTDERILLVHSYRSNDLDRRHPLRTLLAEPDFIRRIHRLELARFTRAELERFLTASTGGSVDRPLLDRYYELSDGNAFFAEELVVSGVLTDPASTRLPNSLSEIMLSRVELLDDAAADVLRAAAAAGRRVSHRLLAAVCDLPDQQLIKALRQCVAQHVLTIDAADDTYVFRHALLREAVYQELLPGERVGLHRALATALTADPGFSLAEDLTAAAELAYHWYEARALPEALTAAVRAGEMAVRVHAFREAEQHYQRVLSLWSRVDDPQRRTGQPHWRVLAAAADTARWGGRVEQALELIRAAIAEVDRAAIAEVDRAAAPRYAGELLERLGNYLWEAGEYGDSQQTYRAAARALAGQPPSAVSARVLAAVAMAEVREGRYAEGAREGAHAVEMARAVPARAEEGRALNTLGMALTMLDQPSDGMAKVREALRIAEEVDHLEDLFRAYGNLAVALEHVGRLTDSVQVALTGLKVARERGLEQARGAGVLANNAAATLVLLGRWDEAAAVLDDVLRARPLRGTLYPRLTLAEIRLAQGSFDAAADLLADVQLVDRPTTDPRFVGPLYACLAELALWRDDRAGADDAVRAGLAALDGQANILELTRMYAVGLRAAADECEVLRTQPERDPVRLSAVVAYAERLADQAQADQAQADQAQADQAGVSQVRVLRDLCLAELARARGTADPDAWAAVARGWSMLGRSYPAGYAYWREAETALDAGDLARAGSAARSAWQTTEPLPAGPLRTEIEAMARRARIPLDPELPEPADDTAGPAARPFGLTARELEVLCLLCLGRTNREIATELFITERTAGVHVSNLLKKMAANNRNAAASMAHRLRLCTDRDSG
ncbi:regulatory LuxR family protein [Micromonospora sp. Llam0]|uniref:helix-turn-helix transcriptional regulator n=1 Tax=Micromonospora sp. Llam0 TaxID=2485143 RepID=UPI000F4A91A4|nr:AAA family ATPase [Micromonospora sp. Llam0]ROO62924.1 regulatory LuxR family protein [Micromonospora sp. Llam0]